MHHSQRNFSTHKHSSHLSIWYLSAINLQEQFGIFFRQRTRLWLWLTVAECDSAAKSPSSKISILFPHFRSVYAFITFSIQILHLCSHVLSFKVTLCGAPFKSYIQYMIWWWYPLMPWISLKQKYFLLSSKQTHTLWIVCVCERESTKANPSSQNIPLWWTWLGVRVCVWRLFKWRL